MRSPENSPQDSQLVNPPALKQTQERDLDGFMHLFNLMKNPPDDLLQAWAKAVARIREKRRKPQPIPVQVEGSDL